MMCTVLTIDHSCFSYKASLLHLREDVLSLTTQILSAYTALSTHADDFFDFAKTHPFAAANASRVLEGEMIRMTVSEPKSGNAQHLRAVHIVPLRTGFQPTIVTLRELYRVKSS